MTVRTSVAEAMLVDHVFCRDVESLIVSVKSIYGIEGALKVDQDIALLNMDLIGCYVHLL
jgi:hypothetical protein